LLVIDRIEREVVLAALHRFHRLRDSRLPAFGLPGPVCAGSARRSGQEQGRGAGCTNQRPSCFCHEVL